MEEDKDSFFMSRAERYVGRFLALPLEGLGFTQPIGKDLLDMLLRDAYDVDALDKEKLRHVRYCDLISLIELSYDNDRYDRLYRPNPVADEKNTYNIFCYERLNTVLLDAEKVSIPVKLFLAMPVDTFFDYMESLTRRGSQAERRIRYCRIQVRDLTKDHEGTATLKDILVEADRIFWKAWRIVEMPVQDYRQRMVNTALAVRSLLAVSFMETRPSWFDRERFLSYYKESFTYEEDCREPEL